MSKKASKARRGSGSVNQSSSSNDPPRMFSIQPAFSGKIWLLARAKGAAVNSQETEIERWFRDLVSKPYVPEDFDKEVDLWGAPWAVFSDNIQHPEDATRMALLNEGFPGAIFYFQPCLRAITEKMVISLTSSNRDQMLEAKAWLKKVIFPTGDSSARIGLGMRFIGFYPQLYGEVIYLRRAAKHLMNGGMSQGKIVSELTDTCDLPTGDKIGRWMKEITVVGTSQDSPGKESILAARILAECINSRTDISGPNTGYSERTIRSKVKVIYPAWDESRGSYKGSAAHAADVKFLGAEP